MHYTERVAPIRMNGEEFRRVGHSLIDRIASHLDTLAGRAVTPGESPAALHALLGTDAPLPETGEDPDAIIRSAADLLFAHSLFNGHPRFLGYITSSPAPIGMLGDLLAAAVNANVGSWRLGPIATEIEAQTVRWIAELIGFPTSCGGLLVSGGNVANMVGLWAARAAAADWDVRTKGVGAEHARKLRVYASAETHTWIQKAADLSGVGTDAVRWVATDASQRMSIDALRTAIDHDVSAGDIPMMVVGTAGSVSTGAVDPLADIAQLCSDAGIWFHVDGAYGAFAATVLGAAPQLDALALADSVAVDPHKWLYAPLEAGAVLVRDAKKLRAAFSYHPPYYHFGHEALNFVDFGPQNSRGFRALKVWLAIRQVGRSGYSRMIGDDISLARRLSARVAEDPELEQMTQGLSITTFRFVPENLRSTLGSPSGEQRLNELNEALLERIQSSGELFLSNAVIGGRYVLRACIVNFNTTAAHIDALPAIIVRMGHEVAGSSPQGKRSR